MNIVLELEQKKGLASFLQFAVEGGRDFDVICWPCGDHAHAVITPDHYPAIRKWNEVSSIEEATIRQVIGRAFVDAV